MSNFARSLKPSSFLTPYRRPGMPGRTLSSSSDLSLTSNTSAPSDDVGSSALSAPGTPGATASDEFMSPAKKDGERPNATAIASSRPFHISRPIAIELPKIKRFNQSSTCTPPLPEPLSARGDLPGGYFPLHEDPKARIHRPHPFYYDPKLACYVQTPDVDAMSPNNMDSPAVTPPVTHSNMPATAFVPSSFPDMPLPMGKYYPSNYEKQHPHHHQKHNTDKENSRPSIAETLPSSIKSDTLVPKIATDSTSANAVDAEKRRRMQQYQRDMVAQAAMALGGSHSTSAPKSGSKGLSARDAWLNSPMPRRPLSPRLLPMGSPGPVTPMELEGTGGGYLDKGMSADRRPQGAGFTAHSL